MSYNNNMLPNFAQQQQHQMQQGLLQQQNQQQDLQQPFTANWSQMQQMQNFRQQNGDNSQQV